MHHLDLMSQSGSAIVGCSTVMLRPRLGLNLIVLLWDGSTGWGGPLVWHKHGVCV